MYCISFHFGSLLVCYFGYSGWAWLQYKHNRNNTWWQKLHGCVEVEETLKKFSVVPLTIFLRLNMMRSV